MELKKIWDTVDTVKTQGKPIHKDAVHVMKGMLPNPISVVKNYGVVGLNSLLLAEDDEYVVRVLHMTRHQHGDVAPHSHRFDFRCLVLEGEVRNRVWTSSTLHNSDSDVFVELNQKYLGVPGAYHLEPKEGVSYYLPTETEYTKGRAYGMSAAQIHDIRFAKGSFVLFVEKKSDVQESKVLARSSPQGYYYPFSNMDEMMLKDK